MIVAPPTGATNKSSMFTTMSHRNTRSWRFASRRLRGGSQDGFHPPSAYISTPESALRLQNLAFEGG